MSDVDKTARDLDKYAKRGYKQVNGWLSPTAVEFVRELAVLQQEFGIHGPACEIGVHHGRLFILLHLLTVAPEQSVAIDLFEMQDENVDGSGKGSRKDLLENLGKHRCDLSRVQLLSENSLRLTTERIVTTCQGSPRLFSIDGGHTAEATRNDLVLADQAVCEGGLIILDDYFNSAWPGVSEGACTFMREDRTRMVPVAITSNKFIFTVGDRHATTYRQRLLQSHPGSFLSTVFETDVVCFEPSRTFTEVAVRSELWLRIRKTPVGRMMSSLKRLI